MSESITVDSILIQVANRCRAAPTLEFETIHEIFLEISEQLISLPEPDQAALRRAVQALRVTRNCRHYDLSPDTLEEECFHRVLSLISEPPMLL